jgi:hypothetical protein
MNTEQDKNDSTVKQESNLRRTDFFSASQSEVDGGAGVSNATAACTANCGWFSTTRYQNGITEPGE